MGIRAAQVPSIVAAALLVLVSACSGGGGSSATTSTGSVPSTTTGTDSADTTPTTTEPPATTTTLPPPPQVPAGMQFLDPPVIVPGGAYDSAYYDGRTWATTGSTPSAIPTCPRGTGPCTQFAANPVVKIGNAEAGFTSTQIDDITAYPLPAGFTMPISGLSPRAITSGANGYVIAGSAVIWDSNLFYDVTVRAVLWHSVDGTAWQRIDLRDVVGDTNVSIHDVQATAAGYIAVGEIGEAKLYDGPTRGLVLTSPDGVTWSKTAELALPWAVTLSQARVVGDSILLQGAEYVCVADGGAMNSFSLGAQSRLWSSPDSGATWAAIDPVATGVASDIPAAPGDPAACPDFAGLSAFEWGFGFVSAAEGTFAVGSPDGRSVSTSTDLSTWTTAELPHGAAVPLDSQSAPLHSGQRIIIGDPNGLVLLSLEARRDSDDHPLSYGSQVFGWRSGDDGASWEQLPVTKPLAPDASAFLTVLHDGSVVMSATAQDPTNRAVYFSKVGPLVEWGTCTPAVGADCSFATLDPSTTLAGADLSGIDLRGTDLGGAVFDGANLTGANLAGAQLLKASFANANLSNVSLAGLSLGSVDLDGANLTGTDLTKALVPVSILSNATLPAATIHDAIVSFAAADDVSAVSLVGLNLQDVSFLGYYTGINSMRGADFTGANLAGASFSRIDLSGANLTGANLGADSTNDTVSFSSDVICPDGAAPDGSANGAGACRL